MAEESNSDGVHVRDDVAGLDGTVPVPFTASDHLQRVNRGFTFSIPGPG